MQRDLDRDIERLGSLLKILNITVLPLFVSIAGLLLLLVRRRAQRTMSRRTLMLLLGSLVVLAILALLAGPGSRRDNDEQLLFPDLKAQLNDVSGIIVRGPGNQLIATLKRSDARWIVAERDYPADLGMIRANLLALAEARIVEEKTSTPELYERLGVQDIALESARGIQLEISGHADTGADHHR